MILVIVVVALVQPTWVRDRVNALGISELDFAGLKATFIRTEQSLKDTGAIASQVGRGLNGIVDQLSHLPNQSQQLTEITQQIKLLADRALGGATDAIQATVAAQDNQKTVVPNATETTGWIYLGKVEENRSAWRGEHFVNALPTQLDGKTLVLTGDVFLHGGPPNNPEPKTPGWRATQPVLRALKVTTPVDIVKTEVNPAIGGGFALWASVKRRD